LFSTIAFVGALSLPSTLTLRKFERLEPIVVFATSSAEPVVVVSVASGGRADGVQVGHGARSHLGCGEGGVAVPSESSRIRSRPRWWKRWRRRSCRRRWSG